MSAPDTGAISPDELLGAPGFVLAVDDQEMNLELVDAILGMEGFEVETVSSGAAALAAVARRQPDCIVLDVMMPGMNGFEVARRLKADRHTRWIPIVMLTALSEVEAKVQGLEVGADDFLNKPVDRLELIARVRSLVKIRRLRAELETSEDIIFSMARALESKSPVMAGHSERVAAGALRLATALGLPVSAIDTIGKAACLHDLGQIGVPERVLEAARPLSGDDLTAFRPHAEIGARILAPLEGFAGVREIIRHHHERRDGSGYPEGLRGEAVPVGAEIVGLVDCYVDLSARQGRAAAEAAVREMAGREFGRALVMKLLELPAVLAGELPEGGWESLLPVVAPSRPGRIVVADDSPSNRELLMEVLTSAGHQVVLVNSGVAARQAIERELPDLVVTDVRMPGLDGFELCQTLKAHPRTELLPVILVTAEKGVDDRKRGVAVGADDFLLVPINHQELVARVRSLLRLHHLALDLEHHQAVILSLANAMEAKDPYTHGHSERVGAFAESLGRQLALPEDTCQLLRVAGYLHDIGKIGIPERLLCKPGKLTADEFQTIVSHPSMGEVICRPLRTVRRVLPLIKHHHERFDGNGYPDHLAGEAIPLGARVLALADAYDALTSERSYRKALPQAEALSILARETADGKWDPKIYAALRAMLARTG